MNRPMQTPAGRDVYVVDGSRTPFLKSRGTPGPFAAADLAHHAGRALFTRLDLDPQAVDEVILGCVSPGPDEANIARVVALRLGCGHDVPAMTVQRNCASGMQALASAADHIAAGAAHLVLAGGTEAMSRHPLLVAEAMQHWLALWGRARGVAARGRLLARLRAGHFKPVIALLRGLTDPVYGLSMGQTAEQLAADFDIGREAMDAFAAASHRRLAAAMDAGHLTEVEPLFDGAGTFYDADTGLRRDTTPEGLARLAPVFDRPFGHVTAGNSAQVTDGAALALLASGEAVARHRLPVLGRIADIQWAALDPRRMGLGPVHAMAPIMERQGLASADVDYWEINEAFAAQVLACLAAWRHEGFCRSALGREQPFAAIAETRLNVDGGAIGLGHPVGASGARIVLHLLKTLKRTGARRGMASLCVGGGQGGAMLVERVED
ncbi:MAG: acetyl-CoA C-acetyltransferase [Gammaproteobacteria bacterium]|nr:acetyl-CoA C-acetyltransferase [Gammaproteobacteria bacterium]